MSILDELTRINLDDMFDSSGLAGARNPALQGLFYPAARGFAAEVAAFDALVGEGGLPAGARWLLRRFSGSLTVVGRGHLPPAGPALILSNHPGMADTVALFVAVGRPDLRIIALDRPFLRALPHTSRQLIFASEGANKGLGVLRRALSELRAGRPVLTFPAGQIEPDPLVLPGAEEALSAWSESAAVFARRLPDMPVIPAIVGGVVSPFALRNPLARLPRTRLAREKLAAMLQIALPFYRRVAVRVAFGPALRARDFQDAPSRLHEQVRDQARALMKSLVR